MSILDCYTLEELEALKAKWSKADRYHEKYDDYWNISGDNTDRQYNRKRNDLKDKNEGYSFEASHPETVKKFVIEGPSFSLHADSITLRMPTHPLREKRIAPDEDIRPSEDDLDNEAIADIVASYLSGDDSEGDIEGETSKRGCITKFSYKSRLRLLKKLSRLRLKGKTCYFVTMTYPGEYVPDMEASKRDLDCFRKAVERAFPCIDGSIWRLESQQRGAPHYHFVFVCSTPIDVEKEWIPFIKSHWPKICRASYLASGGSPDTYNPHFEKHQNHGFDVQLMANRVHTFNYISKYIAKVPDDKNEENSMWNTPGRFWGQWNLNNKKLDFSCSDFGSLERQELMRLKKTIKNHKLRSHKLSSLEQKELALELPLGDFMSEKGIKLEKKQKQHESNVRYAERLMKLPTLTVFGYGDESDNGGIAKKALERATYKPDVAHTLIKCHISPSCIASNNPREWECTSFIDRVRKGLVVAPKYAKRKVESLVNQLAHYHVEWLPDSACICGCELRRCDVVGDMVCCNCDAVPLWTNKTRKEILESKEWCEHARNG